MRERRVDLEGLLGLLDLLLLGHRAERAHVVQAVGELDQDDPDVRGHRDHHLAVVLGLRLVARLERDPGQLGHAVDQAGDLVAELARGPRPGDAVVSSTVSCSSAAHSVAVSRRMPAQILATPTGWVMKSSPDWRRWSAWCSQANRNARRTALAVDRVGDLVGVLGDDREQVGQQLVLERREVVGDRQRAVVAVLGTVDRAVRGDRDRRRVASASAAGRRSGSASVRPLARLGCAAGQVLPSVLEPSLVGHEGGGALERGALRALGHLRGPAPRDRGRRAPAP